MVQINRSPWCPALILVMFCLTSGVTQNRSAPLVFTHVAVIDTTGGPVRADMTVVVTGDRITAVAPSGKLRIPQAAQVVDATGRFLIPGLWDMHVHWYHKEYLPLFIANGVTGIRVMWGMPIHDGWQKELGKGALLGPRMIVASAIVDGPQPIWPSSIAVRTDAEARDAVRKARQAGADFIKVYSVLPRDAFFAIADETKKLGLPFAGHVPVSVSVSEASDAGQKSIEHLTGVLVAASTNEEALRKEQEGAFGSRPPDQRLPSTARTRGTTRALLETFSGEKAAAVFARIRRNHTWHTPTLTVLRSMAYIDDAEFRNDPRLKYLPAEVTRSWDPTSDFRFKQRTPEDFQLAKRVYRKHVEVVGMMRRAGVEFLAGTDVLNPYCFPGFSLHDELSLLVESGFSPLEALQAGTINPARFLGKEKTLGTVETGKIADLVLLDANPLQDIDHTRRINAVIVNGRLLNRAALDAQLAQAEAQAGKK